LIIAAVIAFLMLTWRKGEEIMDTVRLEVREPTKEFVEHLNSKPPLRVPGTAVVLGRMSKGVPLALSHNIRCNHVLYENVLLVAVTTTETPRVSDEDRATVTPIADGITRVELRFGFMDQPDVPKGLEVAMARGQIAKCDLLRAIYYTGHETIVPSGRRPALARWREELFAFMHHNAQTPGAYFKIPSAQIMEIGLEFEI
jgi:KUP system potassium uptake protein